MHCADCYSENMRMVGSISSPSWQCADCGSTKPPVHAHDKPPEAEPAEQEHHVSTEILETCKPTLQGATIDTRMLETGSITSTMFYCDDCCTTSNVVCSGPGGSFYCMPCANKRGLL